MSAIKFPQAQITNSLIDAKLYLPDPENGYYRGVRFDWSGNTESLEYKGHNYFGKWFDQYSPEIHDVIMGPVEEFTPLDYNETRPGDSFLKIGVGVLKKPDDQPYAFSRFYSLLNPGKWTSNPGNDEIIFVHELNDKQYSYRYEKSVKLLNGKSEMIIYHTLRNTGTKLIETSVYDHNFFMIDKQPIGNGYTVTFPFKLKGGGSGIGELAELKANRIVFLRNLEQGETVFCSSLEGFGTSKDDYEIRIENATSGAGVRITCDQPFLKLAFWCCPTTLCPEPYIKINAEPGKEFHWSIRYEFYVL
jgi:hypothetical protein